MRDLGPKARALVDASRSALRATPADRARVEASLRARLGVDALPADSGLKLAPSQLSWPGVIGVAVVMGAVFGLTFLALRPAAHAPVLQGRTGVQPSIPSAASPAPNIAPSGLQPMAADAEPAELVPAPASRAAPAQTPRDPLAQEVALLSRATRELRAGRVRVALKVLEKHQQRFPSGTLSEERRAAKAQALCALGRMHDARAELAELAPGSPAAARAQQVCDASTARTIE